MLRMFFLEIRVHTCFKAQLGRIGSVSFKLSKRSWMWTIRLYERSTIYALCNHCDYRPT